MQVNIQKIFEPYRGVIESIQKVMKPIRSLQVAPELMNSMQQIEALNSAVESIYQPIGVTKMLETFANATSVNIGFKDYSEQLAAMRKGLLNLYEPIKISEESIRAVMGITAVIPNYSELMAGLQNLSDNFSSIVTSIYEESEEEEISELETDFVSNEELQEAIIEQNENPIGFQERVANWAESKKKKYYIAIFILMFVWTNFVQPYFQEYIGVPVMASTVAHVKEFPEKASKLVAEIKEDIEATIIENVPYYYKVTFIDENGEEREGYVSKRSVKLIEPGIKTGDIAEQEKTEE